MYLILDDTDCKDIWTELTYPPLGFGKTVQKDTIQVKYFLLIKLIK